MSTTNKELLQASQEIENICNNSKSGSKFYRYGGVGYKYSVSHYFQSSSDAAHSAVEPGSEVDLIEIIKVLKKYKTVHFAVKGGGHATNAKFSSTTGIQISMARFNQIQYNRGTLAIGAGCLFDEVYHDKGLNDAHQNIVGVTEFDGVGVAGWLLGGGYSTLKTNQFGLGSDNVEAYEVVVPLGANENPILYKVVKPKGNEHTKAEQRLFWALQGGGNNFGIVTKFTLKTHAQGPVYSGTLVYDTEDIEDVKKAVLNFLKKTDKKATIKAVFRYDSTPRGLQFQLLVFCYYDGRPDPDPFKEFLDIDHAGELKLKQLSENIPLRSLISTGENVRGRWGCVMLGEYNQTILDSVDKLAKRRAKGMPEHNGRMFAIGCKAFIKGMFDNISPDSKVNGAWPHKKDEANHPILVYAEWEDEQNDSYWISEMKRTLDVLSSIISQGSLPIYSNTALAEHTRVEDVYRGNLEILKNIRKEVDPDGVMSRAGGFRIPLQ